MMKTVTEKKSRGFQYLLAVVIATTMAFMATPAEACGCGIYLPLDGEAHVSEELVLIRWDGQTEDVVMTLGVLGSSKEAAVIFPVPTPATVKLADAKVFDALQKLTEPRVEYAYRIFPSLGDIFSGLGAGDSPVTLLERQNIGPFDVSTLAATDANALSSWLSTNGYSLPPEIARVLEPYVAQNWYYIAIRLSPGTDANELTGVLDPLWITFDYEQIIYPMRPTALASNSITAYMYILADHRVQKLKSFGEEVVLFADWVDPIDLTKDSPLLPYVTKKLFLTKIVETINQPENIQDDYYFEFTGTDNTYHEVEYDYVYHIAGIPLCLLVPCSSGLLLVVSIFALRGMLRQKGYRGNNMN